MRIYEPEARTTDAAIYWIHGGGMVLGSYDGDAYMNKVWSSRFGCVVISVEYRLAPEHPYPAPLEDCYAGLRWLHRNAADARRRSGRASSWPAAARAAGSRPGRV